MQLGFQPSLHAIGDRANALALDALEVAQRASQRTDLRPRVEHVQVLRPADLGRFAPLGAIASVQPVHAVSDWAWVQARLGAERLNESGYLWKSLAEAGARLTFGSDFPIEPPDPLRGIWAACTRHGWPTTAECLDRAAAIEAFTAGPAWASFEEGETGRIAPGMRADLTAFDRDILSEPPEALLEAEVELVMVGGKATFSD
ncbi:MAG: amidohydrolase family protein [Myxococcales bacterium]